MNYAYQIGGGSLLKKRYRIGASATVAGVPVLVAAADGAGLALSLTTGATDAVGVTVDTGTYSTTQGDPEGQVTVIINPDAVYKIRLNNGATAGGQLALTTNSVASTTGLLVTITSGDAAPNSPEMDEGTIVGVSGANVGVARKITSTAATQATVTVPFPNDIAVGDQFIILPFNPSDVAGDNVNLTSNLAEGRQDIAVGTGIAAVHVDLEVDCSSVSNARRQSYLYAMLDDQIFKDAT